MSAASNLNRRAFLRRSASASTASVLIGGGAWRAQNVVAATRQRRPEATSSTDSHELTVAELRKGLEAGTLSAAALTRQYLRRIDALDRLGPRLNAVIELNPDAVAIAESLDRERKSQGMRGPFHGIPVLIKDNIDTHDRMTTSAGSLALEGSVAPRDSFVVERLRAAGAVILGKTNLSEWANFRGSRSISGWSGRGGLTLNPYVTDRSPSGSSSGSAVAVAANMCAAAIGTETNGSIVSPASYCGVVGFKPTVGLVSRSGIIPIAASQDSAGPMARTVADAAALLGVMAGVDPKDPATNGAMGKVSMDYLQYLDGKALRGARLGVDPALFRLSRLVDPVMKAALDLLQREGAELIDGAKLPSRSDLGGADYQVMLYEFKAGLNAYFGSLGEGAKVKSMRELIEFNERHRDREMPYFGQETLLEAEAKGPLTEAAYVDAKARCAKWSEGIDAVMKGNRLDAFVAPTSGPAHTLDLAVGDRGLGGSSTHAAVSGFPNITVPCGEVFGLPVGLSFFGRAWSESRLIALAYAFEQASRARKPPRFLPTLKLV